ncbi:hypothetical protein T265_00726 [Opisthorchis viverrini]|uniref:protein-tyrosine-phosphatase n=1 Tax=Opisthorchis viverrini TaxID=6198 RepID=A0A075AJH9_OPIVI|nr:hypothetical protein T265_00726 [Opisthorchis viverrini]KER33414.1 hypothetical protein T265_00726 [Opisthorchis viverrini]
MPSSDAHREVLCTKRSLRKQMFLDLLPIGVNPAEFKKQTTQRTGQISEDDEIYHKECMPMESIGGSEYAEFVGINCPSKRRRLSQFHCPMRGTALCSNHETGDVACGPEPLFIQGKDVAAMLTDQNPARSESTWVGPVIFDLRALHAQTCVRIRGSVGIPCESRIKLKLILPMLDDYLSSLPDHACSQTSNSSSRFVILCTEFINEETLRPNGVVMDLVQHIRMKHFSLVRVLKGGFREFRRCFPHLCEQSVDLRLKRIATRRNELRSSGDQLRTNHYAGKNEAVSQSELSPPAVNNLVRHQSFLLPGLSLLVQRTIHKTCNPTPTTELCRPEPETKITSQLSKLLRIFHSPMSSQMDCESPKSVFHAKASQILPFLYIGNEIDGTSEQVLQACNIRFVLNVTPKAPFLDEVRFHCCRIAAADMESQDLRSLFSTAFQFIEESRLSGCNILVHCQAGVSRSPSLVIAYLMAHSQLSLRDAYLLVKSKRSVISPNFSFLGQLFDFEAELNAGTSLRKPDVLSSILPTSVYPSLTEHKDDLVTMAFERERLMK